MKHFNFIFLFFFLLINCCFASNDTLFYKGGSVSATPYVKHLQDTTSLLTINNIFNRTDFKSSSNKVPNFGVSKNTFWLKLIIKNVSKSSVQLELSYPIIDSLLFYRVKDQYITADSTGEAYRFSSRKNDYVNFVFPLNLDKNESAVFYLRLSSGEQIIAPIIVGSERNLFQNHAKAFLTFGIYSGIIVSMILYNLFLLLSTREKSYLYYVTFIFFVGLTQATLNGYSYKYIWPELPWLAQRATHLCGALSGITTILFIKQFLLTKLYTPKFDKLLNFFIGMYVVSIVLALSYLLQLSYLIINIVAGIGSLLLLYVMVYIYVKKQYKPALFFIIAWLVFITSIIIFVLKDTGIIGYNNFTISGLQIGSAIEVILLSFALADKINIFKAEKEKSQIETLEVLQENERIIRDQNVVLESKVHERTTELVASNIELNKTLVELKEAETQLVESEKMASLGQLTAGIAHEINNPINFITGNINPLRRDVDILLSALNTIENVGLSEALSEEKQRQINAYKEDIDFDYLKLEISHLLNGINEGASRTAEIVKGLRVFSRLDEDDLKLADVNEGIDSTLIIINNMLDNNIQVIKNYGNIPRIECYPGKLNQVFLNIISNGIYAIKKQHAGAEGGVLTISTLANADMVTIKIEDNGTGMDENTKKKVFEPFFTTKEVGEGTGLGMSIVYNTIKKHNGSILINSEPGTGTEFTIEVPKKHELSISGPA